MNTAARLLHRAATFLVFAGALAACQRTPPPSGQPDAVATGVAAGSTAPAATTSAPAASSSGAPLDRLIPPSRPGPRALCPLTIEPGVGFGPVLLGETLADLKRAGLKVKPDSDSHATIELAAGKGQLKLGLCQGKVIDIWIDDLREGPDCVTYAGKPVARSIPRSELETLLGGCSDTPLRIGGSFQHCQNGGVYVGHGMGNFVQIRVQPKGFDFDDACAIASDDGSPIELSPEARVGLLKQTLLLRELSPHWHVDKPGRDPLRIVKTPLVRAEPLIMFGSPVVWIDEPEAKPGTAFLKLSKLDATRTRATLSFSYPIEGLMGVVVFRKSGEDWRIEKASVSER